MIRYPAQDKMKKGSLLRSVLIVLFLACMGSETNGKDYLQKLYSTRTLNRYTFAVISQSGDYVLLQNPSGETIAETPEGSEFVPGGMKALYDKKGSLIWKRTYPGFLEFCTNELYLMEPSPDDFKGPLPPAIYYRNDGGLFFRMPEEKSEVYSFDVSQKGNIILAGLKGGTVMIMKNGKKIWSYSIGIPATSVDVAFSQDGRYFLESLNHTLFSIEKTSIVHKINVSVTGKNLKSFTYKDLKDTVYFVLPREYDNEYTPKIYQYLPHENKLFFLDLSHVTETKRKFVVNELKTNHHIYPEKIIFSKFLDHVGVTTTANAFHYFKIEEK